jgi:hypothetical protein
MLGMTPSFLNVLKEKKKRIIKFLLNLKKKEKKTPLCSSGSTQLVSLREGGGGKAVTSSPSNRNYGKQK